MPPRAALAEHRGDTEEAVRLLDTSTQEYVRCGLTLRFPLLRAAPLVKHSGQAPRGRDVAPGPPDRA
ncbi:hypothetical protein ACFY1B_29230 [Streptomyces mirabilis]|uniref:hypothetical protein n=1 Tax=Streptomyces mirabilis TaxID=68239 RepID=UPI0036827254